jgi:OFA family oxalate/formate antiporter-like MFS transporter
MATQNQFEAFEKKRFFYYVLALIIGLMYGLGYTWSVLQTPFVEAMNGDSTEIVATVALVYTVTVLCSTMSPTVLGGIMKKFTEPQLALFGGIMFGVGWLACGHVHTLPMLFLTYAIFTGVGTGLVYPTIMGYVAKMYPEKGGTYTSIYSGLYGGSAMIWSPLIAVIIANSNVGTMSNIIGPATIVILIVTAVLLKPIPEGYIEYKQAQIASAAPASSKKAATVSTVKDRNRGEMIKTGIFYIAMVTFAFGLTSGMFVISQASPILQGAYGLTAVEAATFVSLNSFASLAGRIVFGTVSDHTDKYVTLLIIPIISVIGMGLLATSPAQGVAIACMALVAFGYGGFGGTITPITADLFGTKYVTENFGVMYLNFGIAALIGPRIAVKLRTLNADGVTYNYSTAFKVGAIIAALSVVAAFIVRSKAKASQKAA